MTPDAQLLPCPFCGANAHFEMDDTRWEWVECEGCGMQSNRSSSLMGDCKPMLAAAWNTRVKLGQPAHSEKPVAWMRDLDVYDPSNSGPEFSHTKKKKSKGWVPLYTALHPAPAAQEGK